MFGGIRGKLLRRLRALIVPRPAIATELARTLPTLAVVIRTLIRLTAARFADLRCSLIRQKRPLRLGVDVRSFYEPLTGVGWYLHHLLEHLKDRADVEIVPFGDALTTDDGPRLFAEVPGGTPVRTIDMRGKVASRFTRPVTRVAFVIAAKLHNCDLFFAPNYFLPGGLSRIAGRRVLTVHDLTFRRYPELLQAETLDNLQREMQREIFRADAIVCVSEATRSDLLEFYPTDESKVVTVLSGLAPGAEPKATVGSLPSQFLLFVSTIEPRKNLDALITAFESLKERGVYDGSLVVVGKVGWKSERTVERLRTSRWHESIVHLDYLTRSQLAFVYSKAELFVFPSIYEGFGFPLLEAMAAGVPTVAARSSSLPEVGGDATILFDPHSVTELADAIETVVTDRETADRLRSRGLERVSQFDWAKAADETLSVFLKAAER